MRYLLLILAVIAGIAGYTVYWFVVAGQLERGTDAWIAQRQAEGYQIAHAGYAVSGYPGRLLLTVGAPSIANPKDPGDWSWTGKQLIVYVQPWDLGHVILDFGPTNQIAWREGAVSRKADLVAKSAKASLILDRRGQVLRADADLSGLSAIVSDIAQPIEAGRLELHQRAHAGVTPERPAAGIEVAVYATDVLLPDQWAGPLGRHLPLLRLVASLPPPLPRDLAGIAGWRDDGGTVQVERLALNWGPLDLHGTGTVTLDKDMRPLGALASEIKGFAETLDAFTAAGQIRRNDAQLAKIGLGLIAKDGSDGRPVLKLPITAQDGRLFVGPVALLRLRPLLLVDARNPAQ